ncbi:LytR/AlgR family response regulator transcription factor [Undibacterium sp. TJN25]|uniref:LytR/AlgR family response regulator transcription factor n=1 Tax=Undibacterium sp. TJN25 TaxID=3413056 RepID=UPI003BF22983
MNNSGFPELLPPSRPWSGQLRDIAYGFGYWLVFLLVLEPGNVSRASQSGQVLEFGHEALRIVAAAALSTTATPFSLMLARRFSMTESHRWRHALAHVAAAVGLAFGLILASCFLAAWVFERTSAPAVADIRDQLTGNWLLLAFALLAFSAIAHVMQLARPAGASDPGTAPTEFLTRVAVKVRGVQSFLELSEVDWIESQGNYLALHAASNVYLIRETLVNFEARLDPSRFVRIHRSVIVAINRIQEMQAVANGDSLLRLADRQELRASRRYREAIRQRWPTAD